MSVTQGEVQAGNLEQRVRAALACVTVGPDGPHVLSLGHVYDVVATGAAVRVLIDPERCPASAQDELAAVLGPIVESVPGVARVVFKPRPRSLCEGARIAGMQRVVAVHSGKGGVGKSTIAVNLALALAAAGRRVGLLDADVYGPSCAALLGLRGRARESADGTRIEPFESHGIKVMSLAFLMPSSQALLWRGSLVDEGLPALLTAVAWGELDVLVVDLPPGTSDVHMAVARSTVVDAMLAVSAPGQTSVDDVRRGMEMFADIAVPCVGLIENMAGVRCRHCGDSQPVFGAGSLDLLAAETGVPLLARIPFEADVAALCDAGRPALLAAPHSALAAAVRSVTETLLARLTRPAAARP